MWACWLCTCITCTVWSEPGIGTSGLIWMPAKKMADWVLKTCSFHHWQYLPHIHNQTRTRIGLGSRYQLSLASHLWVSPEPLSFLTTGRRNKALGMKLLLAMKSSYFVFQMSKAALMFLANDKTLFHKCCFLNVSPTVFGESKTTNDFEFFQKHCALAANIFPFMNQGHSFGKLQFFLLFRGLRIQNILQTFF